MKKINRTAGPRVFHQAQWNEPIIFELDNPGHLGVETPPVDPAMADWDRELPEALRRKAAPALPRVGQARVLRHYLRLSQENLGADLNVEIGQGTCTMKYSPLVNERVARSEKLTEIHPLQPDETAQGLRQIQFETQEMLREISGMDAVSLMAQSGSQALMVMASLIRAWQTDHGHPERDEIITTVFSHPSAAASAIVQGFRVLTVKAGPDGSPDYEDLVRLVGPKTAGFVCANPEDTGLYNGDILRFTEKVHAAGGLCAYDQANANGLFGITRAREAGFDLCFFNLHKSFSTPHGCGGPGTGAVCVTAALEPYLPSPVAAFDGDRYYLREIGKKSIGKVRMFHGASQVAVKAYAWMRALGAEGLLCVARVAALNSNYLYARLLKIPGVSVPFDPARLRLEQCRYSLDAICRETGVSSEEIGLRLADYGLHFWTSHHPFIVPNPATLEPTESPSREDLDEYVEALAKVLDEARENPELVKTAPHNSTVHKNDESAFDDSEAWAITWRAYKRKFS